VLFFLFAHKLRSGGVILVIQQRFAATREALGGLMADNSRFTIICPCCEATLTVDSQTGALISHDEKAKPLASFDEMVKGLDKQKQMREQIFAQELSSMKDRDRILEEKFQEAMKRAEKDKDKPYRNPLDID
jgi:hypothetical protein